MTCPREPTASRRFHRHVLEFGSFARQEFDYGLRAVSLIGILGAATVVGAFLIGWPS